MPISITCPYCRHPAMLVSGAVIYPTRADLAAKVFWACDPCQAWVGCHDGTQNPMGRLADAELRAAKIAAHAAFDPLWRGGSMKRRDAYRWLADQLSMPPSRCHIGWFDLARCRQVVSAVANRGGLSPSVGEAQGSPVEEPTPSGNPKTDPPAPTVDA